MRQLSASGQQAIGDIAQRHGFSFDATATMLDSVINGGGGMAQFSHPEFGGSGQWMRGGMTMIGDMFNSGLKYRVDALCAELSNLTANQPNLMQTGSFQSQSQGGYPAQQQGGYQQQNSGGYQQTQGGSSPVSLFVPQANNGDWWGADLRWPNSTGSQNNARYAYFAQARRLAIEVNGTVTIYDTLDNSIGGFSQQQSGSGSLTFSSQYGLVDVASLPVVSVNGMAPAPAFAPAPIPQVSQPASFDSGGDIFSAIEKLAALHGRGLLTDQEFATKKAELLSRL